MKILVSDQLEQSCIDILEREQFQVDNRPGLPAAELLKIIGEYEGLIVRSATKVTAEVIGRGTRLKVIGRAGTGVDNIDVEAATRKGILVLNTPGGNTVSAAEHTISMMLSLARNIPQAHASMVGGAWDRKSFTGTEVNDKTIGVVGLGKIGREVAVRCQGLGMKVLGYDPVLGADVAVKMNIEPVGLEELFRRSDFITVHTPLNAQTKSLLGDAAFAQCKKGVRVVNCARGGIIDEQALLRALNSGQVAGAALDVYESEPPKGNPLVGHPKVVVTPHLGASTEEAQEKVAVQIAEEIVDALQGRAFTGIVNGSAMHLTLRAEVRPCLDLAERIGSLVVQSTPGKLKKLTVSVSGDLMVSAFELVKAGILKGILAHSVHDPVNFINAPFLARELGVVLTEERMPDTGSYTTYLQVRYETENETRVVGGTVFAPSTVRLVSMDGFGFEVRPEGYLFIYRNIDRPGMLAKVGTILAAYNVNIAGLSLGRTEIGAIALTVMNVDSAVPDAAAKEVAQQEGVTAVRLVKLD